MDDGNAFVLDFIGRWASDFVDMKRLFGSSVNLEVFFGQGVVINSTSMLYTAEDLQRWNTQRVKTAVKLSLGYKELWRKSWLLAIVTST